MKINEDSSQRKRVKSGTVFRAGNAVPKSGIYRVLHDNGDSAREITLLRGATFPICKQCREGVRFELVKALSARLSDIEFRVQLYELPHETSEEDQTKRKDGKIA